MLTVIVIRGDNADEVAKLTKLLVADPIAVHQLAIDAAVQAKKAEDVAASLTKLEK